MSQIEEVIKALVDAEVERQLEEKLPEIIRALGLREANEAVESDHFVDAIEIARMLGRDVSTPDTRNAARKHVYSLANQGRIPSVRPTPRRMVFDPVAVRKALKLHDSKAA